MKLLYCSLFFFCLFFLITLSCTAKEVSIDTIKVGNIGENIWQLNDQQLWVFCDTTHQMTYEEVQQLPLKAFQSTKNGKYNLNRQHANHYWFKFVVQNLHPTEDIDLVFNADRTDFSTLYQQTKTDGTTLSHSRKNQTYKDGYVTYYSIPIKISAGQTHNFLFRKETILRAFSTVRMLLLSEEKFQQEKLKNLPRNLTFNLFQGVFFGFLLFGFGFSLIQFTTERDKVYLYYAAYVLSIVGYYLMNAPYLNLALTFHYSFPYGNPFTKVTTFLIVVIYVLFLKVFLGINLQTNRRLSLIINGGLIGLLLLIIFTLISIVNGNALINVEFHGRIRFILIFIGLGLLIPIFMASRKAAYGSYIVFGTLILLVSGLLNNLFLNGKEHYIRNYITLTQLGILVEILFFSLALSLRSRSKLKSAKAKEIATNHQLQQTKLAKLNIQKDKALLQQQLAETELKALKAQLNPHFISNALNGIKLMVQNNQRKQAEDYLADFSNLIRTILINSNESFISLQRELDYAALYLKMESLRFDHQFTYEIEVTEDIDITYVKIPPLLLQPYIENAIWHGLLPKGGLKKLLIKISTKGQQICCIIEDNGVGRNNNFITQKQPEYAHKGHGMNITSERIKINNQLYEAGLSVMIIDKKDEYGTPCGTLVELTIPN